MPAGTPNFIGDRLREAREARGLTEATLAESVGVTRASISLYETGKASPQVEVLVRLTAVLRMPQAFFLQPVTRTVSDNLFYRSLSGATKMDRLKAKRRYSWLTEITSYLRGFVRFPPVRMPTIVAPAHPSSIDADFIESAAAQTRQAWGLGNGPISNVALLLENNGAILSRMSLGTRNMDGFSGWNVDTTTPYAILGNDKDSAARSRFDLAHELGHLVLHRDLAPHHITDPPHHTLIESQAHRFAGAFLLPSETFSEDLYVVSLDSLRALKGKWLVSIAAMLHRAGDLDIVTGAARTRLWTNYNRRGWKLKEPLDDELQPEKPRLLRRAFELIVKTGVHPPEQIVTDLCLSPFDIQELACIQENLLKDRSQMTLVTEEPERSQDLAITTLYVMQGELPLNLNN